jgi:hypothetical protein
VNMVMNFEFHERSEIMCIASSTVIFLQSALKLSSSSAGVHRAVLWLQNWGVRTSQE